MSPDPDRPRNWFLRHPFLVGLWITIALALGISLFSTDADQRWAVVQGLIIILAVIAAFLVLIGWMIDRYRLSRAIQRRREQRWAAEDLQRERERQ